MARVFLSIALVFVPVRLARLVRVFWLLAFADLLQSVWSQVVLVVPVRLARAFPILPVYISYFLFSFLQSRRGEKTLASFTRTEKTLKRGIKKKRGY